MAKKPNPIPNSKPWKPGHAPYSEWLKKLTPAEREAHLQKRRERKAMKQVMRDVVMEFQKEWAAELHNAAWAVLKRARESGDPQAFAAVYDRIVGRPQEQREDEGRPLPWSDQDI